MINLTQKFFELKFFHLFDILDHKSIPQYTLIVNWQGNLLYHELICEQ